MDDYAQWVAYLEEDNGKLHRIHQTDYFNHSIPKELRPSYEELDRSKLVRFDLETPEKEVIISIPFKPGQGGRLIWRRRTQQTDSPDVHLVQRFYVIGKRGAFVAVVLPDYSVVVDDNFDENNVLFAPIDPVEGEETGED